jgi:hypothetical protein
MTPSQYNIRDRSDRLMLAIVFVVIWGLILYGLSQ